jgi:hypothetical protein
MVVMLNQVLGRSEECIEVGRDPKVVDALK